MLTIKVNGVEEKMNIGCRTFITLDIVLRILASNDAAVTLNGESINSSQFAQTTVKGGDALVLPAQDRHP